MLPSAAPMAGDNPRMLTSKASAMLIRLFIGVICSAAEERSSFFLRGAFAWRSVLSRVQSELDELFTHGES